MTESKLIFKFIPEMVFVLPPTTDSMSNIDIPVSGASAHFVISACGGFIVALAYGKTTENLEDKIQFRFQRLNSRISCISIFFSFLFFFSTSRLCIFETIAFQTFTGIAAVGC